MPRPDRGRQVSSRAPVGRGTAVLAVFVGLSVIPAPAPGQTPDYQNISASNQLEYSLEEDTNDEIVEDWFDFDYDLSPFMLGFRYELYHPRENIQPVPSNVVDSASTQGFTYRYIKYRSDSFDMTVGNFYALFGRGMALRLYEDRNIRVDNNLDGIFLEARPWRLRMKALTGRMASNDPSWFPGIPRRRVGQLHAFDVEGEVTNDLSLGTSFLSNRSGSFSKEELAAFRGQTRLWLFDIYAEYGRIFDPSEGVSAVRQDGKGEGYYLATSFNTAGLGLSFEYKDYEDFDFSASDQTPYNNPPALSREHTYALLNRHPHQLNANNEEGYQFEGTWSPDYNTTVLFNHSNTWRQSGQRIFMELYGEVERYFGRSLRAVGAFDYSEELEDSHTKNTTPVVEVEYFIDDVNSFRGEFQHQHTEGDTIDLEGGGFFWLGEFDHRYILLEYARAPKWTISLVHEWSDEVEGQGIAGADQTDRTSWTMAMVSYNITQSNNISVMYGQRHGGFNCVGGVCRFEPEFEGLEVKLFTRF